MSLDLESNNHQINLSEDKSNIRKVYEFYDFRLDAEHLMLYRDGDRVSLTPKQVETLMALLERDGEIVSKVALMSRLWGDAAVEESNLIQNIYVLRKSLGKTPSGDPMIETLRRRGYRFNGEFKKERHRQNGLSDAGKPEAPAVMEPLRLVSAAVPEKRAKSRSRYRTAFAAFGFAVLMAASAGLYLLDSSAPTAPSKNKEFAVLPVRPIDTANRSDIFEIGIADSLIHRLSSVKGFVVRPLSATRRYTDLEQDPIAAGREQRVDYVIASNYQQADGKIKITLQLWNVSTGQVEQTYGSEKEAVNLFAIQDAIAAEVGNKLMALFASTESGPEAKRGTKSEEAYRLYLQGMGLYDKRTLSAAIQAIERFTQATEIDPNYALAWAGKAHAHRATANLGLDIDIHAHYQRSMDAIQRALALDPKLSEAYSALCENKYLYEYDFRGAERECKRALELNPSSAMAREIYSRYLLTRGQFDEALVEIKLAIDLEPTTLFSQRNLGVALFYARRYDEAAIQLKRVIELDENNLTAYRWLYQALSCQEDFQAAFEWFMKLKSSQKRGDESLEKYRTAFENYGWRGILQTEAEMFEQVPQGTYSFGANLYAELADHDKAIEYLEKAYERREWGLAYLTVNPQLDLLRADSRFIGLLKRIEGSMTNNGSPATS